MSLNENPSYLCLWYDKEAPKINEGSPSAHTRLSYEPDLGWEQWSLPIGNGYFGASIFGRCDSERIQITEKTMQNPPTLIRDGVTYFVGGLNSFSETYIDFGHTEVSNYKRYLDLKTAIAGVEYTSGDVKYTREYFTSYPHKALVIKLDADKSGALSFTLRPTIPYKQSFGGYEGDGVSKRGTVSAKLDYGIGICELSGSLDYYGIDFLGVYRVYTKGGKVETSNAEHTYTDNDGTSITDVIGTIKVSDADSAYILACLGTDYELSSDVFTSGENEKPTKFTTIEDTRRKISSYLEKIDSDISGKTFDEAFDYLKSAHISDYSELFGRVSLDLETKKSDLELTTDKLLENYQNDDKSNYLEALIFHYGRYLLISSSRKGALPANLQGVWNTYNMPAWACDYTHNINVEMNYWPAFQTNLAETFLSYVDYNNACMKQAEIFADDLIQQISPELYGRDGGNGWVLGDHTTTCQYASHKSAGNLGFMTQVFWDWYSFTKDPEVLKHVYEILVNAARYVTKCVKLDENGKYLVKDCDSPEMNVDGIWYFTNGTTYAQSFAYLNNFYALEAAKNLGITTDSKLLSREEHSILNTIFEQLDKYDPIHVGLSGQIKEFREEDYYCSLGDEYHHRHISHMVGLYPGTLINANTPAWLDAATVSLNERGDKATGWGLAHRFNAHARVKNGNRTYKLLETILKKSTAPNLWTFHPPFQIDGNFGTAAGISEMLIQSQEGYVSPLAAIPQHWTDGSYSGLVARGGFLISASWESGTAKEFKVTSKVGGAVKIYYPSVTGTSVTDSSGNPVSYTACGRDMISFETEKGESYVIAGFKSVLIPDIPSSFVYIEADENNVNLSWCAPKDAVSYNVYAAFDSAPDYTLIGSCTKTDFTYRIPETRKGSRITFALTSVSSDGYESRRALAYKNPGIDTKYGFIPSNVRDIPFALFKKLGNSYSYIGSTESYPEALRMLRCDESKGDTAVIFITKNADITLDGKESLERCGYETVIFDLGKRTLVLRDTLFKTNAFNNGKFNFTIFGGKLLTEDGSVLETLGGEENGAEFNVSFNNVVFGRERYSPKTVPLFKSDIGLKPSSLNIVLDSCTIDYISATETRKVTLFDFANEDTGIKVSVNGGAIKLRGFSSLPLFNGDADGRIVFGKNDSGESTLFKLIDSEYPTLSFTTHSGRRNLTLTERVKVHHTLYSHYKIAD